MITLIAITAFTSGAVMGHRRALKASQRDLLDAYQAGLYRGRNEQARKIQALQLRAIHLEDAARAALQGPRGGVQGQ